MTSKRRIKHQVRARAAKTGESYTTALRHLRQAKEEAMSDQTPELPGWHMSGAAPNDYDHGIADEEHEGHPVAFVRPVVGHARSWSTLMQTISAEEYLGKRVRLGAFVRCIDCDGWASLWMRVDRGGASSAFDNMRDRAVSGTTTWRRLEVVLDVGEDSDAIAFGTMLARGGEVRVSDFRLEVVGNDVPTTSRFVASLLAGLANRLMRMAHAGARPAVPARDELPLTPMNLDFSGAVPS
jgi:hypothetical protein